MDTETPRLSDTDASFDLDAEAAAGSLWRTPGFPRSGWVCDRVDDLGEPSMECPVCRRQIIRYVHRLSHPGGAWPDIESGCVCSGKLTGDVGAAFERQKIRTNLSRRRANWVDLSRWKVSGKGTHWIRADGWVVQCFRSGNAWGARIIHDLAGINLTGGRYASLAEAKLAAFDAAFVRRGEEAKRAGAV